MSPDGDGLSGIKSNLQDVSVKEKAVLIDFTLPEAFDEILGWCVQHKIPLVCGTTGLSDFQFDKMKKASQSLPLLWSSNMSLGIAFLRKLLKNYATLEGYDFQIEEFHHNKKIDAPSGTAKTLQEDLESALGKKLPEIVSIRGGGIFGVHNIYAMSQEEVITIGHQALNREVFARGAIRAAGWLQKQSPGLYGIIDVIS